MAKLYHHRASRGTRRGRGGVGQGYLDHRALQGERGAQFVGGVGDEVGLDPADLVFVAVGQRDPGRLVVRVAMLGAGRQVLYRSGWVTVIPPEAAARLGGAAGLTGSGAFFEVSELPGGSVWLRATRTVEEFDLSRPAVAAALAPVLIAATRL